MDRVRGTETQGEKETRQQSQRHRDVETEEERYSGNRTICSVLVPGVHTRACICLYLLEYRREEFAQVTRAGMSMHGSGGHVHHFSAGGGLHRRKPA